MKPAKNQAGASGRRAELLRLAAEMFAERGFRATTVRDIADAAGILSGSLYHHFGGKAELWLAVYEQHQHTHTHSQHGGHHHSLRAH